MPEDLYNLFEKARALDGKEHARFLADLAARAPGVHEELLALLAAADAEESFLDDPIGRIRLEPVTKADPAPIERIGAFRVIEKLGAGATGLVYRAEQDTPRRAVALKILRLLHDDPRALRRFEFEAETLGHLSHPNIAQVYQAGTETIDGAERVFIAMELVEGEPITDYARRKRLSVEERCRLMIKVCDAMQHAHQRGLVHRDLKPDNIYVTDEGVPKVLDFGIAKNLDPERRGATATRSGQLIGTLQYMSPEQVAGDPGEVDTLSDVYAIGVLLYEILSGAPPYRVSDGRSLFEQVRMVRESAPTRLRIQNGPQSRELSNICVQALEKDKRRRYQSVTDLRADLARFLRGDVVLAMPPSTLYQLKKLVVRKRAFLAVAGALVLAVGVAVWARLAIAETKRASDARTLLELIIRSPYAPLAERERGLDAWEEQLGGATWLELERAATSMALNRGAAAKDRLDRLDPDSMTSRDRGRWLVLQGDLALSRWREPEEARLLFGAATQEDLDPADRAFAEAMLAETVSTAAALCMEALRADPSYWRAEEQLALLELVSGSSARAVERAEGLSYRNPGDPIQPLIQALRHALANELTEDQKRAVRESARENLIDSGAIAYLLPALLFINKSDMLGVIWGESEAPQGLDDYVEQIHPRNWVGAPENLYPGLWLPSHSIWFRVGARFSDTLAELMKPYYRSEQPSEALLIESRERLAELEVQLPVTLFFALDIAVQLGQETSYAPADTYGENAPWRLDGARERLDTCFRGLQSAPVVRGSRFHLSVWKSMSSIELRADDPGQSEGMSEELKAELFRLIIDPDADLNTLYPMRKAVESYPAFLRLVYAARLYFKLAELGRAVPPKWLEEVPELSVFVR